MGFPPSIPQVAHGLKHRWISTSTYTAVNRSYIMVFHFVFPACQQILGHVSGRERENLSPAIIATKFSFVYTAVEEGPLSKIKDLLWLNEMIHVKPWTSRWVSELNQNQHLQERGGYPQPKLALAAQKLCPCSSSSSWLTSLPHPPIAIWISVMTEFTSNKARLSLVKSYQRTHRTPKHYCWHKSDFRLTAENKQKRRRKDKRIRTLLQVCSAASSTLQENELL